MAKKHDKDNNHEITNHPPQKKRPLFLRIILILAVLLLVYIAAMLTIEIPWVQRLTFKAKETAYNLVHERDLGEGDLNNDIALSELEDTIPFHVELPQWLPDGVEFYKATYNTYFTGVYEVFLDYRDESGDTFFTIIQMNDTALLNAKGYIADHTEERMKIKNKDVLIRTFTETGNNNSLCIDDMNMLYVYHTSLDKQTLIKIIENMD